MSSEDDEEDWLSVLEDAAEVAAAHEEPSRKAPTCEDRVRSESEAQLAGSSVGEEEHGEGKKWQAHTRVRTAAANGDGRTMLSAEPRSAASRREGRRPAMAPRRQRARLARIPANVQDADDILAKREDERYAAMLASGTHSSEEIATLRLRKRHMEEAQDALGPSTKQPTAEDLNQDSDREQAEDQERASLLLALAKLLFQQGRKSEAYELCEQVFTSFEASLEWLQINHMKVKDYFDGDDLDGSNVEEAANDAAEAYQLGGWIKIHSDDHTSAYAIWSRGHAAVPSCPFLARQAGKRSCWDEYYCSTSTDRTLQLQRDATVAREMIGGGAHSDGRFDKHHDLDVFAVPHNQTASALALFDENSQCREVVFRTRKPLLTADECQAVLQEVDRFHRDELGGSWGTVRVSSVKTTDVAVEDIPRLRPWLRVLLETRLWPMLASAYPVLADGSSLLDARTGAWRLRLHDAFIVRYDAEVDLSCSLPEHRDTSSMSFTVALNQRDTDCSDGAGRGDFAGGGTWFEALGPAGIVVDADIGCACAFAGPLRHAGYPITRGTRYILVLFCYVEDFPYGELVNDYVARYGCDRLGVKTTNADLQRMADERLALMEGAAHIPLGWNAHYAAADKIRPVTGETRDNVHEAQCEYDRNKRDSGAAPGEIETSAAAANIARPSGDAQGGYVIYQQTTALVNMLNRKVVSVLE